MRNVYWLMAAVCALAILSAEPAAAQQCPQNALLGPPPTPGTFSACSEADAKQAANRALVAACKQTRANGGMPCQGSCSQTGQNLECTLLVSPLSYDRICAPAEVEGCKEKDDPHLCIILPKGQGQISCECLCARKVVKKDKEE